MSVWKELREWERLLWWKEERRNLARVLSSTLLSVSSLLSGLCVDCVIELRWLRRLLDGELG